ncbi:MAG: hypothetical protein HY671_05000 [Chloroflexi bacterium]|nr:hypothetical protein [Chloroflexota bacterium]
MNDVQRNDLWDQVQQAATLVAQLAILSMTVGAVIRAGKGADPSTKGAPVALLPRTKPDTEKRVKRAVSLAMEGVRERERARPVEKEEAQLIHDMFWVQKRTYREIMARTGRSISVISRHVHREARGPLYRPVTRSLLESVVGLRRLGLTLEEIGRRLNPPKPKERVYQLLRMAGARKDPEPEAQELNSRLHAVSRRLEPPATLALLTRAAFDLQAVADEASTLMEMMGTVPEEGEEDEAPPAKRRGAESSPVPTRGHPCPGPQGRGGDPRRGLVPQHAGAGEPAAPGSQGGEAVRGAAVPAAEGGAGDRQAQGLRQRRPARCPGHHRAVAGVGSRHDPGHATGAHPAPRHPRHTRAEGRVRR